MTTTFTRRVLGQYRLWPTFPQRRVFSSLCQRHIHGGVFDGPKNLVMTLPGRRHIATETVRSDASGPSPGTDTPIHEASDAMQHDTHVEPGSSSAHSERQRAHEFDTYKLVLALQSAGYSQAQAVALMKCLRTVLVNGTEFSKSHYLSRGDLENVGYHHALQANVFRRYTSSVLLCLNYERR
jgi:hypothetical protein